MTQQQILAQIEELKAQNAALIAKMAKQTTEKPITFKVGPSGALCAYGLGRYPVTLYKSQWERVINAVPELQAALKANEALLKTKGE